jgi:signal transduction histidine kinase
MTRRLRRRFLGFSLLAMLGWTAVLGGSLVWERSLLDKQAFELARSDADAAFQRDLVYRAWNAQMGGVYGHADRVEPNPYLDVEHRDLETAAGPLTMVNPSYMTRIVHGLAAQRTGIVSHITSLNPIRPANRARDWEAAALKQFGHGETEYAALAQSADGSAVLRFMRPLMVEKSCLQCHEEQGYVEGDLRGGISVTVPMAPIEAIQAPSLRFAVLAHGGVWLLGLVGIGLSGGAMARLFGRIEDAREQALVERNRAEDADKAKSRFLATMSHELRTPLNAILGMAEMMEHRLFGPVGHPRYEDYTRDIGSAGGHLLALINDVLDLSRIEAGRAELADDRVSLKEVVEETRAALGPRAIRQGIRLDIEVQPNMPPIRADARAVRQMLFNLVGNALRFTPDGGRVLVTVNIDHHGCPLLSVADTGPGIAEDEIQTVLEPFRQGRETAPGGTGLGLPLVKGLIELHGGTMDLFSRVGVGTTVALRFPAARLVTTTT